MSAGLWRQLLWPMQHICTWWPAIYMQFAGGNNHAVALRSGGAVVACGLCYSGPCNIHAFDGKLTYTALLLPGDSFSLANVTHWQLVAR